MDSLSLAKFAVIVKNIQLKYVRIRNITKSNTCRHIAILHFCRINNSSTSGWSKTVKAADELRRMVEVSILQIQWRDGTTNVATQNFSIGFPALFPSLSSLSLSHSPRQVDSISPLNSRLATNTNSLSSHITTCRREKMQ